MEWGGGGESPFSFYYHTVNINRNVARETFSYLNEKTFIFLFVMRIFDLPLHSMTHPHNEKMGSSFRLTFEKRSIYTT